MSVGIAIIGCGFVADYYVSSIGSHPELRLVGAFDRDPARNDALAAHHGLQKFANLDAALSDPRVQIVVNLTSPDSHYDVSRAALLAGKHVYSEKPFALRLEDGQDLLDTARRAGLHISGAPCCVLGECAQTIWKAIRDGAIGRVRLAYAEVEDGFLRHMPYGKWVSASGAAWPIREEVRLGCIEAHGGYGVSWLTMMFGPVREVNGFATCVADEQDCAAMTPGVGHGECGPDWGVACLSFASGMTARITCGRVAPRSRSLRVFGDKGILGTADCSRDRSPVEYRKYLSLRRRLALAPWPRRHALLKSGQSRVRYGGAQRRDFARGIAELAVAIGEEREPILSADYCLHTTEVVHAMHACMGGGTGRHVMTTTFSPIPPMPWARNGYG